MTYLGAENWVPVFDAPSVDEADVVKGLLEASKIPVILDRDTAGSMLGLDEGSESEVSVKVPKEMASKAAQILQSNRGHTAE